MRTRTQEGFTLIELLVVIATIATLAAILFPVFGTVREKARQTVCLSNIRQIGMSIEMYAQDYDSRYPYGASEADKLSTPYGASDESDRLADMPVLQTILTPYIKSTEMWHCPSDTGVIQKEGFPNQPLLSSPSCFSKFHTSYLYRTALPLLEIPVQAVGYIKEVEQGSTTVDVLWDAVGYWHGGKEAEEYRWNALRADGHVKSETTEQHTLTLITPFTPY